MPAAAVIPASVAYIKVAAVKRLAVECQCRALAGGRWGEGTHGFLGASFRWRVEGRPYVSVRDKPPRSCTHRDRYGSVGVSSFAPSGVEAPSLA